jgi:hypothetical protein
MSYGGAPLLFSTPDNRFDQSSSNSPHFWVENSALTNAKVGPETGPIMSEERDA